MGQLTIMKMTNNECVTAIIAYAAKHNGTINMRKLREMDRNTLTQEIFKVRDVLAQTTQNTQKIDNVDMEIEHNLNLSNTKRTQEEDEPKKPDQPVKKIVRANEKLNDGNDNSNKKLTNFYAVLEEDTPIQHIEYNSPKSR